MLVGFLSRQEQEVPAIPWGAWGARAAPRAWEGLGEAALELGRPPAPWGSVKDQIPSR